MKIFWISDFDVTGSGYLNISVPLCAGLSRKGHEVKVAGLQYKGEEHPFEFSIIPCQTLPESLAIGQNLLNAWHFDVMIVALDIPIQAQFLNSIQNRSFPYIGIMPIEADPLCVTWAMSLMNMSKPLIISNFGTGEARKMGVDASHIEIGVDTDSWRVPTEEERKKIREANQIDDDTFVIFQVADNQERKNLSAAMEIVSGFSDDKKVKYILVTREQSHVGWRLRDYAQLMKISNIITIYERGMAFSQLWSLYAMSDLFLLTSKAEGLGMPLLEAMAVGVPCAGTDCTAISEVLGDGRGILLPYGWKYVDPFGNGHRYFVDPQKSIEILNEYYGKWHKTRRMVEKSLEFVKARTWDNAVSILDDAISYVTVKATPGVQGVINTQFVSQSGSSVIVENLNE